MENIDLDNALELYESLDVSSRAADLYFDKVIMQEGLGDKTTGEKSERAGFKKVLEFFQKKNDVNTMTNLMNTSLDGMMYCIENSPYATEEQKAMDKKVLEEYKGGITKITDSLKNAQTELDSLNEELVANNVKPKEDSEENNESSDKDSEKPSEEVGKDDSENTEEQ